MMKKLSVHSLIQTTSLEQPIHGVALAGTLTDEKEAACVSAGSGGRPSSSMETTILTDELT